MYYYRTFAAIAKLLQIMIVNFIINEIDDSQGIVTFKSIRSQLEHLWLILLFGINSENDFNFPRVCLYEVVWKRNNLDPKECGILEFS